MWVIDVPLSLGDTFLIFFRIFEYAKEMVATETPSSLATMGSNGFRSQ